MIEERLRQHRRRKRMLYGTLVAIVLTAAVATIVFFNTYLTEFSVTGNTYLSQEIILKLLFPSQMDRRYFYARWKDAFEEPQDVPMIASYKLNFDGWDHVIVTVEENEAVGGIAYVDSYLYFDGKGYLMYSQSEPLEGIPIVEGIDFQQPVLYGPAATDQEELFEEILTITQLLDVYGLEADRLVYDENRYAVVTMGNVRVNLGENRYMEEKIAELHDMQGGLEGLSGTLHMENYSSSGNAGSYNFYFVRD